MMVANIQAVYLTVMGVWPLVNSKSFQWVTGPKVDTWLVKERISWVYTIDAIPQIMFVAGWVMYLQG